ncbi:hypothetical protein NDU88_005753 [Pleurodeles waltl]|uniref:Prolactin receptor n=1 Tax=Pleurodeles waltl TaxID=8319 RepID=A0AAV7NN96_PLEWA|nr:hypothetical protein NDU88_005753 [Pleurodeles waltl]
MDDKVVAIRVDQDTSGMKETYHRGRNLCENPGGGLEPKGTANGGSLPQTPGTSERQEPPERGDMHPEDQSLSGNPQRDQQNHLTHPKMRSCDKAVQKLQVDDQAKISCDLPDHEDTGIATAPPLLKRNLTKGTFQDQGGDTIGQG